MAIMLGAVLGAAACSSGGAGTQPGVDAAAEAMTDAGADSPAVNYPVARTFTVPLDGEPLLSVTFGGAAAPAWVVIDTGAVRTAIDKTHLTDILNGVGKTTLDLGAGLVLREYEVIAGDFSKARDYIGWDIAGVLGQDLVQKFWFGIDYRNRRAYVDPLVPTGGPPSVPDAAPTWVDYDLVQGLPIVTAQVEGASVRLLADTGSGVTLLTRSRVPEAALSAGLRGYVWHTSYGKDEATLVRIGDLSVGGASVRSSWAVVVPDDHHLSSVFRALGIGIDGFLGYPYYREFFLDIDGAQKRYGLRPYGTPDPLGATEWDRVGIEVYRTDGAVRISMVFSPSDAASRGILPEDVLESVGGIDVPNMPMDDVRMLLRGLPGDSRTLLLRRGDQRLSIDTRVDKLLPPP